MDTEWLRGTTNEEEKKERRELVQSASLGLELLTKLLQTRLDESTIAQQSRKLYDHAAWPFEQADYNAVQRTLREIISLVDLTKDK